MKLRQLGIIFMFTALLAGCSSEPKIDQVITLSSVGNEMKYDKSEITAKAGSKVKLVFVNNATAAIMKHNVVVLKPGTDTDAIGLAAITLAPEHIPDSANIVAHTSMSEPGETVEVEFTVPSEPGKYPFICTYPGHYTMMKGVLVVSAK